METRPAHSVKVVKTTSEQSPLATQTRASPAPSIWDRQRKAIERSWPLLRANFISVVFFALAAATAYRVAIGVLNPLAQSAFADHHEALTNAGMGCVVALIFYMVAACHLENDKARRLTRTLPFGVGLLCCAGYVVWLIFLAQNPGATEYGMIIPIAVWASVLIGAIQVSWSGWAFSLPFDPSRAAEPKTTVGNSKLTTAKLAKMSGITGGGKRS